MFVLSSKVGQHSSISLGLRGPKEGQEGSFKSNGGESNYVAVWGTVGTLAGIHIEGAAQK